MSDQSHLIEQRVTSQQVFLGHFLQAMSDTVKLPNGRETVREYVLHPGAVMVIPQIGEGADLRNDFIPVDLVEPVGQAIAELFQHRRETHHLVPPGVAVAVVGEQTADHLVGR